MTPFRAFLSWFLLLAAALLNGALRQLAFPSTLSDFAARQVSAGMGAVLFGVVIWFVLRRWPLSTARNTWATGALWVALSVLFEIGLVRGSGRPWSEVAAQYAVWNGSLWPLLLAWVLTAPAALSALQHRRVAVGATLRGAAAAWAACGITFMVARAALGTEAAVWIHLAAAPVIGAAATLLVWGHPRHPGVLLTAAAIAGVPALLDAIVVAPFLERSFAMFASLLGTWLPLAMLFAASAATGAGLRARSSRAPGSPPAGPRG
jgi:hypothetical protein